MLWNIRDLRAPCVDRLCAVWELGIEHSADISFSLENDWNYFS